MASGENVKGFGENGKVVFHVLSFMFHVSRKTGVGSISLLRACWSEAGFELAVDLDFELLLFKEGGSGGSGLVAFAVAPS